MPHKAEENSTNKIDLSESELLILEKKKVKSAIITDFILSVEIVIITLGSVFTQPLTIQIPVVSLIALIATIGVYGVVALIVRMDDFGYQLINLNPEDDTISDKLGIFLIRALPWVIKSLGVIGTIALFLVSGGLFVHNLHFFHHLEEILPFPSILFELLAGVLVGMLVLIVVLSIKWVLRKFK